MSSCTYGRSIGITINTNVSCRDGRVGCHGTRTMQGTKKGQKIMQGFEKNNPQEGLDRKIRKRGRLMPRSFNVHRQPIHLARQV